MPKMTLTFNLPEERSDAELATKAGTLYCICHDLSQYIRTLDRYDERESLPKEEVIEKIRIMLDEFYSLNVE